MNRIRQQYNRMNKALGALQVAEGVMAEFIRPYIIDEEREFSVEYHHSDGFVLVSDNIVGEHVRLEYILELIDKGETPIVLSDLTF